MSNQNKNYKIISIIFVILILVITIGITLNNRRITANTIADLENELKEKGNLTLEQERELEKLADVKCKEVQVPYDAQEEYAEQEPYSEEVCKMIDLQYSKINNKWDYNNCLNYDTICYEENWLGMCKDEETFCSERELSYSVDINNQDNKGGMWKVEIRFYMNNQPYETKEISNYLYPQTTETFTGIHTIYGNNPEGDANQNFGALAVVVSIPQKQECETVTKYRTITKTRTVTKYREETVCE